MPGLDAEDGVLVRAATTLVREGEPAVADALLASSTLAVTLGSSWSDGFDGYVDDVHVTLTVGPDGLAALTAAQGRLRRALAAAVDPFVDARGTLRRGDLVGFALVGTDRGVPGERVERRRAALREAAPG